MRLQILVPKSVAQVVGQGGSDVADSAAGAHMVSNFGKDPWVSTLQNYWLLRDLEGVQLLEHCRMRRCKML